MIPPRKLVRYVERTEGKRFKKVPTYQYSTIPARGANHVSVELDKSGKDKKVAKATIKIHKKYSKPIEDRQHRYSTKGVDKLILIHEMRENLHFQHNPNPKSKTVHQHAIKQEPKDVAWLKKQGYLTKHSPNTKSRNYF